MTVHDDSESSLAALLLVLRRDVETLAANRLTEVYPEQLSSSAKTPFKLAIFREGMYWRFEELARCSLQHYQAGESAAAITLTRAAFECAAALCYLFVVSRKFVNEGTLEALDEVAEKLLQGSKSNPDLPQAISVLTMLDKADREMPGVRGLYNTLSEYAHPNWDGNAFLYSKNHPEELFTSFGSNPRNSLAPAGTGLHSLKVALQLFQYGFNGFTDCLEPLVRRCEEQLEN